MLGNDPQPYYVVGTGLVSPEESEAKSGRIIIFQWKVSVFAKKKELPK